MPQIGDQVECQRCGYRWAPRVWPVKKCPHCQSYKWEVPKGKK